LWGFLRRRLYFFITCQKASGLAPFVHFSVSSVQPLVRKLGETHTQPGDKVRFLAADVFLPSPAVLSAIAEEETHLEGTVLSFSDSGQKPRFFAVVEVLRTHSLVVPVEKMKVIKTDHGDPS
jgi:hypothetical protein